MVKVGSRLGRHKELCPEHKRARLRVGRRLRLEREAVELSQERLARMVSEAIDGAGGEDVVKEHLIRCVEVGDMSLPTEFLPYFARVLGITVPRLLGEIVPSKESLPHHSTITDTQRAA